MEDTHVVPDESDVQFAIGSPEHTVYVLSDDDMTSFTSVAQHFHHKIPSAGNECTPNLPSEALVNELPGEPQPAPCPALVPDSDDSDDSYNSDDSDDSYNSDTLSDLEVPIIGVEDVTKEMYHKITVAEAIISNMRKQIHLSKCSIKKRIGTAQHIHDVFG